MKIELLYPEVANLYGDQSNIEFLQRSAPQCEVVRTALEDTPAFLCGDIDLVYIGSMTERSQCIVLDQLFQIKEPLFEAVENSQAFLVTGNALELFGTAIDDIDGTHIDGLGLFPFHTVRDMLGRYSSLYLGKYKDIDIVGYKSQFTQSYPDQPIPKLFDTVRGPGINRDSTEEGIHYKGFMGTYLLGPLLVLNPPFLIDLVEQITGYIPDLAFQDACIDAYRSRVTEYSDPARGFYY